MIDKLTPRNLLILLVVLLLFLTGVYLAALLPSADWFVTFDPAARGIFTGHSPYEQPGFIYPPWMAGLLLPLVLLPPFYAHGLMFMVCLTLLALIARRLQVSLLTFAAFLLSPTAFGALLVNNIDPLVVAGMLLPPVWGLFLLVAKPQIGIGVAIYYLGAAWQKGRFWGVVRTFAPLGIAYSLAAILFPVWIQRLLYDPQMALSRTLFNRSTFPYLIPLGLFFLWLAFRNKNPYFALAASLFFAPYHTLYSYAVFQLALMHPDVEKYIRRDVLQIALTVFFWVVTLAFGL
jgi:hypothetical protein